MSGKNDHLRETVSALRTARRINVIGTSGTGKTTFSRALASVLGISCHEMDRMFWQPGWTASDEDEFLARVKEAVSGERWILDGNYNRATPIKWATVECVVWLDYPFHRTLRHAVSRAFRRSVTQEEIWPGTGNRESLRKNFFSRDSVLLWTLKTYRSNRASYRATMDAGEDRAFVFVRIGSPSDARRVLELISSETVA